MLTMTKAPLTTLLRQVRSFAVSGERPGRSDGELLRAFLDAGHEQAFEEIVRRHGAMVLGVCRRSLGSLPDAEDAFQATFLVLLRRASSIRQANSLASWLHGVARRVAADARRATTRRQNHEQQASPRHAPGPANRVALREACLVLEEEISRLPATYREPFVLCCLEHLSCAVVAARLKLTEPAVRNRLSRARKMLRHRLTQRGISLSAAFAAVAPVAGGAVPTALRGATRKAAAHLAAGGTLASVPAPAAVIALVEGGSRTMFPALRKLAAATALALAAVVLAVAARQGDKAADGPKKPPLPAARQEEKPAVDRYGDALPLHAVARLGTLRFRAATGVTQAAVVPGGKQLLALGFSSAVLLWDAATGREVRRFEAAARKEAGRPPCDVYLQTLAVSPDGKTFAVGAKREVDNALLDCALLLFDLATGRKLAEWPAHQSRGLSGYPLAAFVTPTLLVSAGDDGTVRVWDVTRQRELHRLALPAKSHVSAIVPSPDRKHILVAGRDGKGEGFWTVWEAGHPRSGPGKLVHQEKGLPGYPVQLAFSPDGGSLALAMGMEGPPQGPDYTEMRLYAVGSWTERRRWKAHAGDDAGRCSVAFSPDGTTIATGGADGKVCRWDAVTAKELGPAMEPSQKHSQNVIYLDTATLVTYGFQETVNFWEARTGQPRVAFLGTESQVQAVAYSPDGRHVAVGGYDGIRVWEVASARQITHLRDGMHYVSCLHFSPDGKRLLSGDVHGGSARLWDWASGGAPSKNFSGHESPLHSVAFSPDGQSIATGDAAGIVRVWAVSTGQWAHALKCQALKADTTWVSAVAFGADGQSLFCSTLDGVRHWDLATGKEVRLIPAEALGHSNAPYGLAISPGGRWGYSSSYDGSIAVWEAGRGQLARVLKQQEPSYNGPVQIALSHDGTRLAAGFVNHWDNPSVHLWDLTTGQKVAALTGHRAPVTQLAFSRDGRRLVSGSCDTTALVWDVTRLKRPGKVPDGTALAGLWKDLGAGDPKVAYAAVCQGARAGDTAVARLRLDLKPAVAIDAEEIAARARQLDSDRYAQREEASRALAAFGPSAEAALLKALKTAATPEARRRLERVLKGQEAEHRRLGYAVEVLEMIGTRAARRLLVDLSNGAGSRLTRDARAALERLEKR
jgi:RNA polymerase sigma factor (sigma-70 family)